jgi:WD40 repeat protein
VETGRCIETLRDHTDEVLDVCFSPSGLLLCSASADGQAFVYETADWSIVANLTGHEDEISAIRFNPQVSIYPMLI